MNASLYRLLPDYNQYPLLIQQVKTTFDPFLYNLMKY